MIGPGLLVARSELRRRWLSLLFLAVIVAVVTATVLAAVAGARRTSTVLDRFLGGTAAHDLHATVLSPDFALEPGRVDRLRQELARLPGVETVSAMMVAVVGVSGTQYDFGIVASPDGAYYRDIDRPIIVDGRLPSLDAVDEIAVNETAAAQFGLGVGDVFSGPAFDPPAIAGFLADEPITVVPNGPTVSATVVGVVRMGDELSIRPQSVNPGAIASPAFFRVHADRVGFGVTQYALGVDRSAVDIHDVLAVIRADVGTQWETFAQEIDDEYAGEARSAYRSLASGLLVFAAIAGVVGVLAVLQAVRRHVALGAEGERILGVLGMTTRQRVWAIGGPCALAVGVGILGGLGGAVALSPLFPLSVARRAEISPGVDADVVVLALGATVLVLAYLAIVVWIARRALSRRAVTGSRHWAAHAGRAVRWAGPAGSVGVTMALDPGVGPRGVPSRSALLGSLLGVAGIVGAGVFVHSVDAGQDEPGRFGWTWDSQPDLVVDDPEGVVAQMVGDPDLAAIAVVTCGPLRVGDRPLFGCAFDDHKGSTAAPITAGRPPAGPGEVALGRVTMERLGISLGETVRTTRATLTVVGRAVIPMIDNAEPGEGAILTTEGLRAAQEAGGGRYLLLTYADGVDRTALEARLTADYGTAFTRYSEPEPPGKLLQLGGMTGLLGVLGGVPRLPRRHRSAALPRRLRPAQAARVRGAAVPGLRPPRRRAHRVLASRHRRRLRCARRHPARCRRRAVGLADGCRLDRHDRHAGGVGGPAGPHRRRRPDRRRVDRCGPWVAGHPSTAGRRVAGRVMTPAGVIALAQVRHGWRRLAVLAVFVAVASGLAMAGIAGARRTFSVLDRAVETTAAWDVLVNPDAGSESALSLAAIAALPMVADASRLDAVFVVPEGGVRSQRELENLPNLMISDGARCTGSPARWSPLVASPTPTRRASSSSTATTPTPRTSRSGTSWSTGSSGSTTSSGSSRRSATRSSPHSPPSRASARP